MKNAPAALTSAVSVAIQGSPRARTKTGTCMSNRGFLRRSPARDDKAAANSTGNELDCIQSLGHVNCQISACSKKLLDGGTLYSRTAYRSTTEDFDSKVRLTPPTECKILRIYCRNLPNCHVGAGCHIGVSCTARPCS